MRVEMENAYGPPTEEHGAKEGRWSMVEQENVDGRWKSEEGRKSLEK